MNVWILIAITLAFDHHGKHVGLQKDYVDTFGSETTCQQARRAVQPYGGADITYFCQKELVK
jgi:hypothetical protein